VREVQNLLGYKSVETAMIYTHVLRDRKNAPRSPVDALYRMVYEDGDWDLFGNWNFKKRLFVGPFLYIL